MNSNGYLATRRGLLEHLRDGRLTLQQKGCFQTICELADWRTGVWWGSARALAAVCGVGDVSERQARHLLEALEAGGYIRRFVTPGTRGNYPIVVHKFEVRLGELIFRVNAEKSEDWRKPFLEPCQVQGEVQGEVSAPSEEVRSNTNQKKGKPPAAAQPADPRHYPFVEFTTEAFKTKYGQPPTWSGKGYRNLGELLKRNPNVTVEELHRRWGNFMASTDDFTEKQRGSLAYFCASFDKFIKGPLLARPAGGGANGKKPLDYTGTDRAAENFRRRAGGMAPGVVKALPPRAD